MDATTMRKGVTYTRRCRGGIAMILVLGLIAIASVLSWAMLSTATVRAQVEATVADSLDAAYQADSGVSYAMYYVRYPELSPVANQTDGNGGYTTSHNGLKMWSGATGTTDVQISTAGDGLFSIRSTAVVDGVRRTSVADAAYTYDRYAPTHAAGFNGGFTVPANMKINGPVVSKGLVVDLNGKISNSPAIVPALTNVVPTYNELTLVAESAKVDSSSGDRAYTVDGVTYWAEIAPTTITGTLVSTHPLTNPKNVWVAKSNVAITNATINGTLVVLDGKSLTVNGLNTITPYAEMPAVIVSGILDMKSGGTPSRLTANGCVWLGGTGINGSITDTAAARSTLGYLKVNGALLFGGAAPGINSRYVSQIEVVYDAAVSKIPALSTAKTVNGVAVRGWRTESN